jgi:hypothetical protein
MWELPKIIEIAGDPILDLCALANKSDSAVLYRPDIGEQLVYSQMRVMCVFVWTDSQPLANKDHLITAGEERALKITEINKVSKEAVSPWGFYQFAGYRDLEFLEPEQDIGWSIRAKPIQVSFKKCQGHKFTRIALDRNIGGQID